MGKILRSPSPEPTLILAWNLDFLPSLSPQSPEGGRALVCLSQLWLAMVNLSKTKAKQSLIRKEKEGWSRVSFRSLMILEYQNRMIGPSF